MQLKAFNSAGLSSGQAMVETIVVLAVSLLLIMGSIQFALMYTAKSTLNYATFEAARAGALNYGDKRAVEFALAMNLSPLNTSIQSGDNMLEKITQVKRARNRMLAEIDAEDFVCIERISPPSSAFEDHGVTDPTGKFGGKLIPNDHLKYRSSKVKGSSKLSLQDANLLKLRVTYCHPMIVPMISTAIQKLMGVPGPDPDPLDGWQVPTLGSFHENCYTEGRMPIVAQAIVRMQTPMKDDSFASSCE
ncbi:MAG: hypothetical protein ACI9LY_001682 [Arenicella sp.]